MKRKFVCRTLGEHYWSLPVLLELVFAEKHVFEVSLAVTDLQTLENRAF